MKIFLIVFSSFLVFITFLPIIKNEYWVFRIFDYPRLQKLVANFLCILLLLFFFQDNERLYGILLCFLVFNFAYLFYQIYPFTRLGKKQVLRVTKEIPDQGISIMISNVFQDNKNYKGCIAEIAKANPDLVLLLETNPLWEKETRLLEKDFAYHIKIPLENTYGMLLYSKLELNNPKIKYLVEDTIPSIHTKVILKNGQPIQLFALHPTPPVPTENVRSTERDKELLLVAEIAKDCKLPVIVIGDLNDVAWSYTTELFLKMSGLLDPRRGRGFYNTFHAHHNFLRFPLDHAFISTNLKLKTMRRLHNFDSDHFPIFISLQYEAKAKLQQHEMEPDQDDIDIAEEKKSAVSLN